MVGLDFHQAPVMFRHVMICFCYVLLLPYSMAHGDQLPLGQCDPLDLFSCNADPAVEACYVNIATVSTQCAPPGGTLGQNEPCQFVNICAPGLGCVLKNEAGDSLLCSHQCDPETGITAQHIRCSEVSNLAKGRCSALNDYYLDIDIPGVGMCIDCSLAMNELIPVCTIIHADSFEGSP